MVTGKEISKLKQKIRMLKDRDRRDKKYSQLKEKERALQSAHTQRHMTAIERGIRGLPQQIRKDIKALQKTATSKSTQKKLKKMEKLLTGV